MENVKDVLKDVLHDLLKKQKNLNADKVQAAWGKIVGPKANRHTKIVHITKDKIWIHVDSSAWLYEMNLHKERIRKELRGALEIQEVVFRLGSVKT
ncbi:MAG: DciA family protein [Candidatus Omnitrophota bacterium]